MNDRFFLYFHFIPLILAFKLKAAIILFINLCFFTDKPVDFKHLMIL